MTQLPDRVRQSNFLNQVIIDRTTTEELGRVEVLWMYVPKHRVLGFVGKSGLLGNKKFAFKLEQVQAIGEGGIVTQGQPETTTPDRVKRLESLMQHEVWTEGGERLGKVTDCVFNLKTGEITHYLFVSSDISGILGSIYQVSPRWIGSIGEKRILLSVTAIVEPYQESLPQKITKTAETLKEEAVQEWRSITEKATGQIKQIRSQVKERSQEVSERLREEAQTLAERAKEQSQTLAEQVKEQSQTLAEQVKEQSQILSRQLEEGIQTLTVQAEEIFDRSDEPETRQYSYEEADFDWDWDELDEEPSGDYPEGETALHRNPQGQSASQRSRGFNTFVDAKPSSVQGNRVPSHPLQPGTSNTSGVEDPGNPFDPNAIDDFDFDDDFWSDEPASSAPVTPKPASEKSQPAVQEGRPLVPPLVPPPHPMTPKEEQLPTADADDLDDEPWI